MSRTKTPREKTALYVYCLVRSAAPPSPEELPPGLPGLSRTRLLDLGDSLWLAVADAPLPEYGAASIEARLQDLDWVSQRALPHEEVIERFTRAGTVLPMKLFTLFSSEERAQAHLLADRERLRRTLDRVEGCVEWGVRIRLDEARGREALARQSGQGQTGPDASGTSFLLRKKKEQEVARRLSARLRSEVKEAFAELARAAEEAAGREPAPAEIRLLLDAAFLVRSDRVADFEAAVQRCAERLADSACEVTLSGPWPPYNFVGETE